ncbi:MAG: acetate--CoA ligase alpha subunit [Bacillota bacterium]
MPDLETLFNPAGTVVVGASRSPGKIGHALIRNILSSGYQGKTYAVNPTEKEILGVPCFPSVKSIGKPLDLAVLAVPPAAILEVVKECGDAGVKNLVVITAGFKEIGKEGLEMEKNLVDAVRGMGMRMVGPNCLGIIDTHTPINATFAKDYPLKGNIAFISQSGAMCVAILDWSLERGIGFSKFISLGNKGHLNEADFIADAAGDPNTRVILCYLEDVANGPQFLEVTRKACLKKPVIVLKAGRTQAGAKAASSHTGALAGSDLAYEVAFRQSGVLRADTVEQLFAWAVAFASQPVPHGENLVIVTNSGGPGIIATDSTERRGLKMAHLAKETIDSLREALPRTANVYNPVDVIGDAGAARYRLALEKTLGDPGVDVGLVILSPTAVLDATQAAQVVLEARQAHPDKPILASFMGGQAVEEASALLFKQGVPCYPFPEPAVEAIQGLVKYGKRLKNPPCTESPQFGGVNTGAVKEILRDIRKEGRLILLGPEAIRVARAYGIPCAPSLLATRADEAAYMADLLGFPVILKVASPKIFHKTDVGGVKPNLKGPEEVRQAFLDITESVQRYLPGITPHGIEVQRMAPKGVELIVGMTRDVQFGPLIAFGLGGIYVNLLKDVAFRLADGLSEAEARLMMEETKAFTLIRGFRGEKPKDCAAIAQMIQRVAQLALDFPEITEMDINPVMAYDQGALALDVKITIS